MKRILKNIGYIKSTILGLCFIGTGIYIAIQKETYNEYLVGGLIVSGILLLFVPDKFINGLEKMIFGKSLNLNNLMKKKENEDLS